MGKTGTLAPARTSNLVDGPFRLLEQILWMA